MEYRSRASVGMGMTIKTCKQALGAWKSGHPVESISISGFGGDYEHGCQRLMFAAIEEQIEHEGDAEHWQRLHEDGCRTEDVFPSAWAIASEEGMTGAMWGFSINAAVVLLRNGWEAGIAKASADRRITVTRTVDHENNVEVKS